MGIVGFARIKSVPSLLTGIAFGFTALYHLFAILNWGKNLAALLIAFNIITFVLIMVALYILMGEKKRKHLD